MLLHYHLHYPQNACNNRYACELCLNSSTHAKGTCNAIVCHVLGAAMADAYLSFDTDTQTSWLAMQRALTD